MVQPCRELHQPVQVAGVGGVNVVVEVVSGDDDGQVVELH